MYIFISQYIYSLRCYGTYFLNFPLLFLNRMKSFIEENERTDPLIFPMDKKMNPWSEKVENYLVNIFVIKTINHRENVP